MTTISVAPAHACRTCRPGEGLSPAADLLARLLDQGDELPVAELDVIVNGSCTSPRAHSERPLDDDDEREQQW